MKIPQFLRCLFGLHDEFAVTDGKRWLAVCRYCGSCIRIGRL